MSSADDEFYMKVRCMSDVDSKGNRPVFTGFGVDLPIAENWKCRTKGIRDQIFKQTGIYCNHCVEHLIEYFDDEIPWHNDNQESDTFIFVLGAACKIRFSYDPTGRPITDERILKPNKTQTEVTPNSVFRISRETNMVTYYNICKGDQDKRSVVFIFRHIDYLT